MAGAFKHGFGCGCCECPQSLCVSVECENNLSAYPDFQVDGATITVKNALDEVVGSCITGSSTGGYGAEFSGASGSYLSAADASTLRGSSNFWVAGWFKPKPQASLGSTIRGIVSKCATASTNRSWQITHTGSTINFTVNTTGGDETVGKTGALALGEWTFFFAAYQSDLLNISVDGGSFSQLSPDIPGVIAGTSRLVMGASHDPAAGGSPGYCIGTVDQVAIGQSPTSSLSTIRDLLYNLGNGKRFADLSTLEKSDIGLEHFWELEESTGLRGDEFGSSDLTTNGTVTNADGVDRITYTGAGCCFDIVDAVPVTYTVEVVLPEGWKDVDSEDTTLAQEVTFSSCTSSKSIKFFAKRTTVTLAVPFTWAMCPSEAGTLTIGSGDDAVTVDLPYDSNNPGGYTVYVEIPQTFVCDEDTYLDWTITPDNLDKYAITTGSGYAASTTGHDGYAIIKAYSPCCQQAYGSVTGPGLHVHINETNYIRKPCVLGGFDDSQDEWHRYPHVKYLYLTCSPEASSLQSAQPCYAEYWYQTPSSAYIWTTEWRDTPENPDYEYRFTFQFFNSLVATYTNRNKITPGLGSFLTDKNPVLVSGSFGCGFDPMLATYTIFDGHVSLERTVTISS